MRTSTKLGLLASLYLAQGLPFGFFTVALPALMRSRGMSLPDISLTSLLALPWALKFLWAPFVDRFGSASFGRRRSWILPLQVLSALVTFGLAFVDPAHGLPVLMAALFITNLLAATQDIATDGLAVELLTEGERGHGNGVQVAAYRVGMILGGGFLIIVFDWAGWLPTFGAMAAMLALSSVPIALYRERAAPRWVAATSVTAAGWLDVVKRPGMPAWLTLLAVYKCGNAFASGMVKPFMIDKGMSLADVGLLLGTVGFAAGLLGAVIGGWASGRFGRKNALIGCGLLEIVGVASYIAPAAGFGGERALWLASTLEHLTGGMATVSLFTMMMDACDEATAGTDYTVQASVVVIATGVASVASGFSAKHLGYADHFALSALLASLGLIFAFFSLAPRGGRSSNPGAPRS